MIVNGVDLTEKFGMVLSDGYTLSPPTPKTYIVDIPCGNGKLDLTESLYGDVTYDNRKQEFTFYVINVEDFERIKTEISVFLHGKSFDYELTMDPGYIYHGRFTITSCSHAAFSDGIVGVVKVSVDASPYKYKPLQTYTVSAAGGILCQVPSGRKRVQPTFETSGYLELVFDNKRYILNNCSWSNDEILFTEGNNEVFLSTGNLFHNMWGHIKDAGITWGKFKTRRVFEWYKSVLQEYDSITDAISNFYDSTNSVIDITKNLSFTYETMNTVDSRALMGYTTLLKCGAKNLDTGEWVGQTWGDSYGQGIKNVKWLGLTIVNNRVTVNLSYEDYKGNTRTTSYGVSSVTEFDGDIFIITGGNVNPSSVDDVRIKYEWGDI